MRQYARRPTNGSAAWTDRDVVVESEKVFGRYLTPYLEALDCGAPIAA